MRRSRVSSSRFNLNTVSERISSLALTPPIWTPGYDALHSRVLSGSTRCKAHSAPSGRGRNHGQDRARRAGHASWCPLSAGPVAIPEAASPLHDLVPPYDLAKLGTGGPEMGHSAGPTGGQGDLDDGFGPVILPGSASGLRRRQRSATSTCQTKSVSSFPMAMVAGLASSVQAAKALRRSRYQCCAQHHPLAICLQPTPAVRSLMRALLNPIPSGGMTTEQTVSWRCPSVCRSPGVCPCLPPARPLWCCCGVGEGHPGALAARVICRAS
jgi:hypothetical protein